MYIIKNAWKSIIRSKGRNILIGIIVLVISVSSIIALSIKNSAMEIIQNTKDSFNITAMITVDRRALMEATNQSQEPVDRQSMQDIMSSVPSLTLDDIKKFGDSNYLKGYSYSMNASLNSTTISPLTNESGNMLQGPGGREGSGNQGDFRFVGYSSTDYITQFVDGTYKIVEGAVFEDSETSNVCVISDELANENDLSVGNTITFHNPNDDTQTWEFTIAGIYQDTSVEEDTAMSFFSNAANQIITPFEAINKIVSETSDNEETALGGQLSSVYYLKDADSEEAFKSELTEKGLNEYYTVNTNIAAFEESVKPLNNLNQFANVFLILVLLIGGIILVVLNMINIRERKYEVGVLRAIGMKNGKVLLQFIAEFFAVTFISLLIGSGVGSALSVPAANMMLKSEIQSLEQEQEEVMDNFGRGGQVRATFGGGVGGKGMFFNANQDISYIDQINAIINPMVLLQMLMIGIILTLISSSISVILISRYEPLKILSNRT